MNEGLSDTLPLRSRFTPGPPSFSLHHPSLLSAVHSHGSSVRMRTIASCWSINLARTDPSYELKISTVTQPGSVPVYMIIRPHSDQTSLIRINKFTSVNASLRDTHTHWSLWSGPDLVRIRPTWRTVRSFSAFWESSSGILFRHKTSWSRKPTVPLKGGRGLGLRLPQD